MPDQPLDDTPMASTAWFGPDTGRIPSGPPPRVRLIAPVVLCLLVRGGPAAPQQQQPQPTPTPEPTPGNQGGGPTPSDVVETVVGLGTAFPGYALDLVAFTGITGPLTSALTQIAALGPGIKALVGFVGFVVALISLSALRNFGPVLFYVGLAIFAAVGLVIAGAIMGAVV